MLKVVIVMARCNRIKQNFGIRFEEKQKGRWTADWAFAVKETYTKLSSVHSRLIVLTLAVLIATPKVSSKAIAAKLIAGMEKLTLTCAWCGQTDELSGQIETLSVGVDY